MTTTLYFIQGSNKQFYNDDKETTWVVNDFYTTYREVAESYLLTLLRHNKNVRENRFVYPRFTTLDYKMSERNSFGSFLYTIHSTTEELL